jgi:hypothetical protein
MVWPRFALWLLRDIVRPTVQPAVVKVLAAIDAVAALYERWIVGDKPSNSEWRKARDDAAAYAYAYAYTDDDARAKCYTRMADKLVELLAL